MNFSKEIVERALQFFDLEIDLNLIHDGNLIQTAFRDKLVTQEGKECINELIENRSILLLQAIQNTTQIGCDPTYPKLDINYQCKFCKGVGAIPFMEVVYIPHCKKCPSCEGSGIKTEPCRACKGTGKKGRDICGLCKGSGKYEYKKNKSRKTNAVCPECSGLKFVGCYKTTGRIIRAQQCSVCKGKGQVKLK